MEGKKKRSGSVKIASSLECGRQVPEVQCWNLVSVRPVKKIKIVWNSVHSMLTVFTFKVFSRFKEFFCDYIQELYQLKCLNSDSKN